MCQLLGVDETRKNQFGLLFQIIVGQLNLGQLRVTPHDVEGSATLKQREMNLDYAIVDDTPPSKQVCETSSGNRTPMR